MAVQDIAVAVQRVESILWRRPETGLHDDAPGVALWQGGLRVSVTHANGAGVVTDMPAELGGGGGQVSPGWLMRAGLASCAATCIAMEAAREGIELDALEVRAVSRSDLRGLLGIAQADGGAVDAGPMDMQLHVRIAAAGVAAARLRALVERAQGRAPVSRAIQGALPLALHIEAGNA